MAPSSTTWYSRLYKGLISPPSVPKQDGALRFGLLGASNIAPLAIIGPAKSHPEVVIQAVAARDRKKAEAYAKKHGIPVIHDTYQALLDDASVDCIYIALPNGLHYEWALRCIQAGKHVLLEKPSTSNATEARLLFEHPLVTAPNAPVLLEAFHTRFHPSWRLFLWLVQEDPMAGPIVRASSNSYAPKGLFPTSDIRFVYDLAGGALMDFGTYNISQIRDIFGQNLEEVVEAKACILVPDNPKEEKPQPETEEAMTATYKFPNGGTGSIDVDFRLAGSFPQFVPASWRKNWPAMGWPIIKVKLGEKEIDAAEGVDTGTHHMVQRDLTFWNPTLSLTVWHRIDVVDLHTLVKDEDRSVIKTWKETKHINGYEWPEALKGEGKVGEPWWSTFRHQLEEFVNKIRGREGSGVWISGADSIGQMQTIDETYKKAGLKARPTSTFRI